MKILYVTTIGSTMVFFKELVRDLLDQGHTVDIACNDSIAPVPRCYHEWNCRVFTLDCARTPFSPGNLKAMAKILKLVRDRNYDIVHCHTPVASFCTRLACAGLRKQGIRVMYTAHGFHFYAGAPLLNWLLYYPAEKLCAPLTDVLVTINQEDYDRAASKLHAKEVVYIPGVGVDIQKFAQAIVDRDAKRTALGIPEDAFLLISVGELNNNKNHQAMIRAMAELNCRNVHYIIAGAGPSEEQLLALADQLGISRQLHLLGFRKDVAELYKAADVFCFPSIREGLPVSVIEAMAAGLPVISAINRGTVELVQENRNGFLCNCSDISGFAKKISILQNDPVLRKNMAQASMQKAEEYRVERIVSLMEQLYTDTAAK